MSRLTNCFRCKSLFVINLRVRMVQDPSPALLDGMMDQPSFPRSEISTSGI